MSLSLSPDSKSFVSGACDASAKVLTLTPLWIHHNYVRHGVRLLCAFTEGVNLFAFISLLLLICCYVMLSMGNATTSRKFWGSFLLAPGNIH